MDIVRLAEAFEKAAQIDPSKDYTTISYADLPAISKAVQDKLNEYLMTNLRASNPDPMILPPSAAITDTSFHGPVVFNVTLTGGADTPHPVLRKSFADTEEWMLGSPLSANQWLVPHAEMWKIRLSS
jgi:hypothetical protein